MSKTVKFTVVYHLEEQVPDDWDEGNMQFYIEENHCLDNHAHALARLADARPGYCGTCCIGEAYLGHIPFKDISELFRKRSAEKEGDGR